MNIGLTLFIKGGIVNSLVLGFAVSAQPNLQYDTPVAPLGLRDGEVRVYYTPIAPLGLMKNNP